MKALKEKRISLRSLWRRGLVILSLFALVFASCGDSSSSDDTTSGGGGSVDTGPKVVQIKVIDNPTAAQYMGIPIDLTGLKIEVVTADGKYKVVSYDEDKDSFSWSPKIFTGAYLDPFTAPGNGNPTLQGFKGLEYCTISYKNYIVEDAVDLRGCAAWGIVRPATITSTWPVGTPPDLWGFDPSLHYTQGLRWTGESRMKKEAYVDQTYFDFSGLTLEADYFRWAGGKLQRDSKTLKVSDITWDIVPLYDKKGEDCTGVISFTVGHDYTYSMTDTNAAGVVSSIYGPGGVVLPAYNYQTDGVTSTSKLDTVHVVKSIKLKEDPVFDPYFYWEANDNEAWKSRLAKDATLVITYTGGDNNPQEYLVADLAERSTIWKNANANANGTVSTTANTQTNVSANPSDFNIIPIKYPLTTKLNPDPEIILYYRGATKAYKVDVFTTLDHIDVVPVDGDIVRFNPVSGQDNDTYDGDGGGSIALAKKLNVKATYVAYNSGNTTEIPLRYKEIVKDGLAGSTLKPFEPYYTFAKDGSDQTYINGWNKWRDAVIKDKAAVTEISRAVTISHRVFEADFDPIANTGTTPLDGFFLTGSATPYAFGETPNFTQNLKWTAKDSPTTVDATPWGGDIGWRWVDNTQTSRATNITGSGIKQPPKAATNKIDVIWIVQDAIATE